jgi:hypothetical protein
MNHCHPLTIDNGRRPAVHGAEAGEQPRGGVRHCRGFHGRGGFAVSCSDSDSIRGVIHARGLDNRQAASGGDVVQVVSHAWDIDGSVVNVKADD